MLLSSLYYKIKEPCYIVDQKTEITDFNMISYELYTLGNFANFSNNFFSCIVVPLRYIVLLKFLY